MLTCAIYPAALPATRQQAAQGGEERVHEVATAVAAPAAVDRLALRHRFEHVPGGLRRGRVREVAGPEGTRGEAQVERRDEAVRQLQQPAHAAVRHLALRALRALDDALRHLPRV